jgi:hypothetical protein
MITEAPADLLFHRTGEYRVPRVGEWFESFGSSSQEPWMREGEGDDYLQTKHWILEAVPTVKQI